MILRCILPYVTPEERGVVAEAWQYLLRRFPHAEFSLVGTADLDVERTLREDSQEFYSAAVLDVSSSDPSDDGRCQDERTKLVEFLADRYAALGLPAISEQRIECYPLE